MDDDSIQLDIRVEVFGVSSENIDINADISEETEKTDDNSEHDVPVKSHQDVESSSQQDDSLNNAKYVCSECGWSGHEGVDEEVELFLQCPECGDGPLDVNPS